MKLLMLIRILLFKGFAFLPALQSRAVHKLLPCRSHIFSLAQSGIVPLAAITLDTRGEQQAFGSIIAGESF